MTSHRALMMFGVVITQLQSALSEQLIFINSPLCHLQLKNEMESTHWSGDLIEVKTVAYTISRLPKPSSGSSSPNKVGF